jgi:hypothetical protein
VDTLLTEAQLVDIKDGDFGNYIHPSRLNLAGAANYAIIKELITIQQAQTLIESELVKKSFELYSSTEKNWGWDYFSGRLAEFTIVGL